MAYKCNWCGGSVSTSKFQSLMLDRYGMTTWIHDEPYDWQNPEDCALFPRASPDFSRPVDK